MLSEKPLFILSLVNLALDDDDTVLFIDHRKGILMTAIQAEVLRHGDNPNTAHIYLCMPRAYQAAYKVERGHAKGVHVVCMYIHTYMYVESDSKIQDVHKCSMNKLALVVVSGFKVMA